MKKFSKDLGSFAKLSRRDSQNRADSTKLQAKMLCILAVLVVGLALVGCKNEPTDIPEIVDFKTGTGTTTANFVEASTFTAGATIAFYHSYKTPYQDLARRYLQIKKGGVLYYANSGVSSATKGDSIWSGLWTWTISDAGSYTAEFYVEDIDGKTSSRATASFTITQ